MPFGKSLHYSVPQFLLLQKGSPFIPPPTLAELLSGLEAVCTKHLEHTLIELLLLLSLFFLLSFSAMYCFGLVPESEELNEDGVQVC